MHALEVIVARNDRAAAREAGLAINDAQEVGDVSDQKFQAIQKATRDIDRVKFANDYFNAREEMQK